MKIKISPENAEKQFKIHISRAQESLKGARILLEEEDYRRAVSRSYYSFLKQPALP